MTRGVIRRLHARLERWPLAQPFTISTGTFHDVEMIVVEIMDGDIVGRGEAVGIPFAGETPRAVLGDIEAIRAMVEAGADHEAIGRLLKPGGARNAIDCALWELRARQEGVTVADLAGAPAIAFRTATTIGLAEPETMAAKAAALPRFGLLKLKLGAQDPIARLRAVRAARPDARLIIDVNAAWSVSDLYGYAPACVALGVEMIEQPCTPACDAQLNQADVDVTLCADESCLTSADLERLQGHFGMVNIKLDKTGGLTEALKLARHARALGFEIMVGNMIGTSLAMAPASLICSFCRYVDLDGPLLLAHDRVPIMPILDDMVSPLVPLVWGG